VGETGEDDQNVFKGREEGSALCENRPSEQEEEEEEEVVVVEEEEEQDSSVHRRGSGVRIHAAAK